MNLVKKIQSTYLKHFESILYISIFSIFLARIKLYIPLFALNILLVLSLILTGEIKLKLSKWQIAVLAFMGWSVINSTIAMFIFKNPISLGSIVKLNLNLGFLIAVSTVIKEKTINMSKNKFINFLEFIIIINCIQIVLIYLFGGLLGLLFSDGLTQTSSSAYAISAYYNVIGTENKNIWAGKFTLLYIVYLYITSNENIKLSVSRKLSHIILGLITILLLLSRTAQVAVIIPVVFLVFYSIRNINYKYRVAIYSIFAIATVLVGVVLFNKFFHIKFDMTDGGYTRLYIWGEAIENMWKNHWIVGNGIGNSGEFIKLIVDRTESNLHNVYLNIFYEMGLVGIGAYITFLVIFIKDFINRRNAINIIVCLVIPFVAITMLQYLGFDNDIVMVFILVLIMFTSDDDKKLTDVKE